MKPLAPAGFPERRGWFTEYYEESRSWVPPGFRDWPELEGKAATLRVWSPSVIDGLVQTEAYARSLLETAPGATAEMVSSRLASRMERQRRVLMRDDPPSVCCLIDHTALYRIVGSPEIMAAQASRLLDVVPGGRCRGRSSSARRGRRRRPARSAPTPSPAGAGRSRGA
jgi:hypothetical protein